MKFIFLFLILSIQSLFGSESEDLETSQLVYNREKICGDDAGEAFDEAGYTRITPFIEKMREKIVPGSPIKTIKITGCNIDNEGLELIKRFLASVPEIKDSLEFLDFSANPIGYSTANSPIESILAILDPSEFPKLKALNLLDTAYSSRNILKLVKSIVETAGPDHKDEALEKIGKLIFLDKTYLWHAKHKVLLYNKMAKANVLPPDWYERHQNFFKSPSGRKSKVGTLSDGFFDLAI